MTASTSQPQGLLYSSLSGDPDMALLVDQFVGDLPERVQKLVDHLQASDWEGLCRVAHQLTGAAGSYGFHEITAEAARLECALIDGRSEAEITARVNVLVDLCRRARSGCAR